MFHPLYACFSSIISVFRDYIASFFADSWRFSSVSSVFGILSEVFVHKYTIRLIICMNIRVRGSVYMHPHTFSWQKKLNQTLIFYQKKVYHDRKRNLTWVWCALWLPRLLFCTANWQYYTGVPFRSIFPWLGRTDMDVLPENGIPWHQTSSN